MVCVRMGGGGLYHQFGKNGILGDFLGISKKSFANVPFFCFSNFWAKKLPKSDFRTPLAGGPKVRYNTPQLIRGVMTLNKMPKNFALMMKLGRTPKEDARIMPNLNLPTFHCLMTSK